MTTESEEELGRLKGIRGSLRRPLSAEKELEATEGSLYQQWWRCLRASKAYLECCDLDGRNHPLAATYEKFEDVRMPWRRWWPDVGRRIFSERLDYPKVRAYTGRKSRDVTTEPGFLILEVPLGLTRVTILEQINDILAEHHEGRNLDVWAQSSAKVKLHKSRLQIKTLPKLVEVAEILFREPDILLYDLAVKAELAEVHLGRSVQEALTDREEHQRREMAASRYKAQATNLVFHAARGKFPCVDDPEIPLE